MTVTTPPDWARAAGTASRLAAKADGLADRESIAAKQRAAGQDPASIWKAAGKGIEATLLRAGKVIPGMVIRGGTVVAYSAFTGYARVRLDDGQLADIKVTDGHAITGSRVSVEYPPTGGGARISGIGETAWAALPLLTGWTAGSSAPRYKSDSAGNVIVQGLAAGAGGAGPGIGTLPARFRPARPLMFPVWAPLPGPGFAYAVSVSTAGVLSIPSGVASPLTVSLDGIIFPVEA